MLTEEQKQLLPERIAHRLEKVNEEYLQMIGRRIKEIGTLSASDAHRLSQMREYGADVEKITQELAEISEKNIAEIYEIYDLVAQDNAEFSEQFFEAVGKEYIPYQNNEALKRLVYALAKQTAETYINLSQTTGFMMYDKSGKRVFTSLSKTYQNVIDDAVMRVVTGEQDYQSAMRSTLRDLADSGIRTKYSPLRGTAGKTADYASGYSRRLDTAVRQNILWGVKQCNISVQEQLGKEFGADGYEIDYHANPRPSHAAMGGRQYVIGRGREINGQYYPPFDSMSYLLSDYGCLHFKWSIICGVSAPAWSSRELEAMKARDRRTFTYEGKQYTGYEATQMQRKLETAARNAKDRQIIAKAAGDDELRRLEQQKINAITQQYKAFSEAAGLPTRMERMSVSGYRRVRAANELTNTRKNDIIRMGSDKDLNIKIDKFTPCLENAKTGEIIATSYSLASNSELKALRGWKFDWTHSDLRGREIYKLTLKGSNAIQGLVAITKFERDKAVYVNIAESAPNNLGKHKEFNGVGGHLFAIAAQRSVDLGYGGFVFMDAKNLDLVEHYSKTLGATLLGRPHPYRMFIDEEAAEELLRIYTLEVEK